MKGKNKCSADGKTGFWAFFLQHVVEFVAKNKIYLMKDFFLHAFSLTS